MWKSLLIIIAGIFTFFILGGANGGGGLVMLIGAALVIWGIISFKKVLAGTRVATPDLSKDGYQYSFASAGTGIAISPQQEALRLEEKGRVKEYSFDMIRSWEANLQEGGMSAGTGVGVGAANYGQLQSNIRNSGFFVYTKDIENPVWRIQMLKKIDQAKWMEIMQQYVNRA